MKQYEYYTLTNDTYLGEKILNKLGEAGWELITHAYQQTVHHVYTFKREKAKEQIEYQPGRTNEIGPK
jgi:hypothetical protein